MVVITISMSFVVFQFFVFQHVEVQKHVILNLIEKTFLLNMFIFVKYKPTELKSDIF